MTDRYHVKWTWAKDPWQLCHRVVRKVLSHTVMVRVCTRFGLPPL